MARRIEDIRNIGIVAHIDAGKTTVTERMLFYAGATHRPGDVDKGTTTTDFDPEEQQRGITIYSACVTFPWKHTFVNLIDTPGHVDFTAEVERSLRVLDGAVVVFSAREGVEAQSETVWRQANKYHVPRICFINKLDREGADFYGTLEEMCSRLEGDELRGQRGDEHRERHAARPLPLQIPLGAGPPHFEDAFRGVVDLVEMQLFTFQAEEKGANVIRNEIPEEIQDQAEKYRRQLLEELFNYSDELANLVLEEAPVPVELIRKVVREATLSNRIQPVLCGSALDFAGIQPLLDAVAYYLPSPAEVPPVEGVDPKHPDKILVRKANSEEPFCGLVFKILADKHGDLYYVRVYSGRLKGQSRVLNAREDKRENVSQLWHIQADQREPTPIDGVEAGDIVGVLGLRSSITGDTICDPKSPIVLESITFPEPVISMAIEPETTADRKKLADTLDMLRRQDPTFSAKMNEETGQTIISGMGELHLEIIKNRLLREFNLNVKVHKPRVSYRETIREQKIVTGECHPGTGPALFAKVKLQAEPDPEAKPFAVRSLIKHDAEEAQYDALVVEILTELAQGGGLSGFPLLHVRLTLLGIEIHETQTNEIACRKSAADAFTQAFRDAGELLEPIMALDVTVPDDFVGEIIGDLQQRRAIITNTSTRGKTTIIEAEVPLANMLNYSSSARGLSQGRATFSMEPHSYGPAPAEVREHFLSW